MGKVIFAASAWSAVVILGTLSEFKWSFFCVLKASTCAGAPWGCEVGILTIKGLIFWCLQHILKFSFAGSEVASQGLTTHLLDYHTYSRVFQGHHKQADTIPRQKQPCSQSIWQEFDLEYHLAHLKDGRNWFTLLLPRLFSFSSAL